MESFMKEFEHLKIQLEDIKSATNNFDEAKVIGRGGFGKVYKGELSHFKGRTMVAIKCLDRKHGQGETEFWKEITMLSRHTHENLITLLGFCVEGGQMILVYEHASNGSLDNHLSSINFTWTQRLKTCLGAARGLSFLHDAKGTTERIIHCDIKSANILLDENWNAKVSDMGLSKIAPANQNYTGIITQVAGTYGYCDPSYMETSYLTKESDVYSFGVLLLEVLFGRLCFGNSKSQFLVPVWEKKHEQNKLQEIILDYLKQQIDQMSLNIYSDIAFKCLNKSRKERPMMSRVVEELEAALENQELCEGVKLTNLKYRSESELLQGILVNGGKTWFSRNMNGDHCEMISIEACLTSTASKSPRYICTPRYTTR
ncbi:receptor-like protein kinase ANXUR1 isoform X1 [Bidens hawaiensis]|uniref:receptor-like protein kinase ANXUR1 isoform X1 n=1 Tax=Bidens hawaiensis TaxID=980011 RepID=UPI00404AFA11